MTKVESVLSSLHLEVMTLEQRGGIKMMTDALARARAAVTNVAGDTDPSKRAANKAHQAALKLEHKVHADPSAPKVNSVDVTRAADELIKKYGLSAFQRGHKPTPNPYVIGRWTDELGFAETHRVEDYFDIVRPMGEYEELPVRRRDTAYHKKQGPSKVRMDTARADSDTSDDSEVDEEHNIDVDEDEYAEPHFFTICEADYDEPEAPPLPGDEAREWFDDTINVASVSRAAERAIEEIDEELNAECHAILREAGVFLEHDEMFHVSRHPDITKHAKGLFRLKVKPQDIKPWRDKQKQYDGEVGEQLLDWYRQAIKHGVLRHSQSPVNNRMLVVPKKSADGKTVVGIRIVIDLRKANELVMPMFTPMPSIDEVFRLLGNKTLFFKIDCPQWFYSIGGADEPTPGRATDDQEDGAWTTAFTINTRQEPQHHVQFRTCPQGFVNSSAVGQNASNTVFEGLIGKDMNMFMDDGHGGVSPKEGLTEDKAIRASEREAMLAVTREIARRCVKFDAKLHPAKCFFGLSSLRALGHIHSRDGLSADPAKVEKILAYPRPTNADEVRVFNGMMIFQKRYVPNYSVINRPLNQLLRKDIDFVWDTDCELAFTAIKNLLSSYPVLRSMPDNAVTLLKVDGCLAGLSFVLSFLGPDGAEPVVEYGGRALTAREQQGRSMPEIELMAIVEGIEAYSDYIGMRPFIVISDAKDVVEVLRNRWTTVKEQKRLQRMALQLQGHRFAIVHRKGEYNDTDAISRMFGKPAQERNDKGEVRLWKDNTPTFVPTIADSIEDALRRLASDGNEQAERLLRERGRESSGSTADEGDKKSDDSVTAKAATTTTCAPAYPVMNVTNPPGSSTRARTTATMTKAMATVATTMARDDIKVHAGAPTTGSKPTKKKEAPRLKRFGIVGRDDKDARRITYHVPTEEDVAEEQRHDPYCQDTIKQMASLNDGETLRPQGQTKLMFTLKSTTDGHPMLIVRDHPDHMKGANPYAVMVIPKVLRRHYVDLAHYSPLAGHQGAQRTRLRLGAVAWWPGMYTDVEEAAKRCRACQRQRQPDKRRQGEPREFDAREPFERLQIDLVGPFVPSVEKDIFILSMVDSFSGYSDFEPIKDKRAITVAKALTRKWILKYGAPAQLLSDQGTEFCNRVIKSLCDWLWIDHVRTAAYHPQTNGKTERYHRDLESMMRKYAGEHHQLWSVLLDYMAFCLNTSTSRATGTTPFRIVWGRDPRIAFDAIRLVNQEDLAAKDFGHQLASRLNAGWEVVREFRQAAHDKDKLLAGKAIHHVAKFGVGDYVWRRNPHKGDPARMVGPFKVLADASGGRRDSFRIRTDKGTSTVNVGDLMPYLREVGRDGLDLDGELAHDNLCHYCGQAGSKKDGSLLMCELCPHAVHANCEGIVEGDYKDIDFVCKQCKIEPEDEIEESEGLPSRAPRPLIEWDGKTGAGGVHIHERIIGHEDRAGGAKGGTTRFYKTLWAGMERVYTWEPRASFSSTLWPDAYDYALEQSKDGAATIIDQDYLRNNAEAIEAWMRPTAVAPPSPAKPKKATAGNRSKVTFDYKTKDDKGKENILSDKDERQPVRRSSRARTARRDDMPMLKAWDAKV